MNPDLLNELKQHTQRFSIRNRFSSSGDNSNDYLELENIDLEKNSEDAEDDFDLLPPPNSLLELPKEISIDYNNDIIRLNKKINYKLCYFGLSIIIIVTGMGAIYKSYII